MFELTINGEIYEFNFGMGFLREMNKSITVPVDGLRGVTQEVGLKLAIGNIIDGDLESLCDVLLLANKGKNPRLTAANLDAHIENPETDVESLFDEVLGFFGSSNATKKTLASVRENIAKAEANQ